MTTKLPQKLSKMKSLLKLKVNKYGPIKCKTMDLITNNYRWVGIPTVLKIISRWYNERGGDDPTGDLSDILVFAF